MSAGTKPTFVNSDDRPVDGIFQYKWLVYIRQYTVYVKGICHILIFEKVQVTRANAPCWSSSKLYTYRIAVVIKCT